jgi:hypothetical protein
MQTVPQRICHSKAPIVVLLMLFELLVATFHLARFAQSYFEPLRW